ncbi:hypothetical protein C5167_039731 [Papaver somniferum]|uniref:Uncharacterized protein n=1 Tax=Papaver somniferum TaxID=3469 RepID=A0A4Y7IH60_PAPSO|nr:hypothetical protein C5167_039731 [Papaver somniferum]
MKEGKVLEDTMKLKSQIDLSDLSLCMASQGFYIKGRLRSDSNGSRRLWRSRGCHISVQKSFVHPLHAHQTSTRCVVASQPPAFRLRVRGRERRSLSYVNQRHKTWMLYLTIHTHRYPRWEI